MSKNTIRKGLAFGLGLSLVGATFAGFPANAAITTAGDGTTAILAVAPTSGPASALAITAADGATFSLTASPASAIMGGGELKYKVTDPNAKFLPGANSTGGDSDTFAIAATDFISIDYTADLVSLTTAGVADGSYQMWTTTDLVLEKTDLSNNKVVVPADTLVDAIVSDNVAVFKSQVALVTADALVKIEAAVAVNFVLGGSTTVVSNNAVADNAVTLTSADVSTQFVQIPVAGVANGTYYGFFSAALVTDGGALATGTHAAAGKILELTVTGGNSASFTTPIDISADADADASIVNGATTLRILSAVGGLKRAADNSYVVSTGITAANTTAALELVGLDAVTRSVTATAFVDAFADDIIGATEYASAPTVVQFLDRDDITASTVLTTPVAGDQNLTATITTSPMINVAQDGNSDLFEAVFTRQDSTSSIISIAGAQSALTGAITATADLTVTADNLDSWTAATGVATTDNNAEWESVAGTIMTNPAATGIAVDETKTTVTGSATAGWTVTVETDAAHGLMVGDVIDLNSMSGTNSTLLNAATGFTVGSIPTTTSFNFTQAGTVALAAMTAAGGTVTMDVITWPTNVAKVDRVYAGDYTAQAVIESAAANTYTVIGAKVTSGNTAAVAADVIFDSVASATVQGRSLKTDDASEKILVKKGTTSATVTLTVVDSLGVAVSAGRPVVTTLSVLTTGVKVNGLTAGQTLSTDANGQVTLTVTSTNAADGDAVTIAAVAEGVSTADSKIVVEWDAVAYGLYDLNTTVSTLATDDRSILAGSSYTLDLLLADQWFTAAPSDTYRLKVTGSGVTEGYKTLTAGKTSVVVTDGLGTDFASAIEIQKATSGVFATTSTVTLSNKIVAAAAAKVTLASDGQNLYMATAADLSDAVAAAALVERDLRSAWVAAPVYTNSVVVTGKVTKVSSGASYTGAQVTISGSTSILFRNGDVDSRGSITVVASNSGEFSVELFSTTAMTDSVITVSSLGASSTTKVSFTGTGVGEGTSLVITAPAAVKPATTFQVSAKLTDAYGNAVDTAAGRVKVTYTGSGIVWGTLPTETDSTGSLSFAVLLGSNDSASAVVTVSYDQNGDGDYVDAKDLTTTSTTEINAAGVASSGATVVNAGSFLGYVAVYAKGHNGSTISWKIAGKWFKTTVTSDYQVFQRKTVAVGMDVNVDIYIDSVKVLSKVVATR